MGCKREAISDLVKYIRLSLYKVNNGYSIFSGKMQGAAAGLICSLIIMFWIGVGTFIESPPTIRAPLPHYATHCEFLNHTTGDPNSTLLNFTMTTGSFDMYNISSVTETMSMLYNTTMTSETMTTAATNMTAEADR